MLAIERTETILEILKKKGIVRVEELARSFNVSEMTIRRDLSRLEKDGIVTRCHGGAILNNEVMHDTNYHDRQFLNIESKKRIAMYCLRYIKSGSTIYLDAGSTVYELAKLLIDIPNLTVITNDIIIANVLVNSNIDLIMLGGQVRKQIGCIDGNIAEAVLDNFWIETSFVSGLAVNRNFDLFSAVEGRAHFKRKILERSNKNYLMLDSSKFYKQSIYRIDGLSRYTAVVTDKELKDNEQEIIKEKGINWNHVE